MIIDYSKKNHKFLKVFFFFEISYKMTDHKEEGVAPPKDLKNHDTIFGE